MSKHIRVETTEKLDRLCNESFRDIYIRADGNEALMAGPGITGSIRPIAEHDVQALRPLISAITADHKPEDDSIRVSVGNDHFFRATGIPALKSGWFCVSKIDKKLRGLEKLGYGELDVRPIISLGHGTGILLIGGPPGHGKTTTASNTLSHWLATFGRTAFCIEEPAEMDLQGYHGKPGEGGYCFQASVEPENPQMTYAALLRKALRTRTHYLFLGEIRDADGMSTALRLGLSGSMVIATIHGDDIYDIINSVDLYLEQDPFRRRQFSTALAGIVVQKLPLPNSKKLRIEAIYFDQTDKAANSIRSCISTGDLVSLQNLIPNTHHERRRKSLP